jgi:murein DD-endopeptidase MepM/ murein hydrolase activator NlpD
MKVAGAAVNLGSQELFKGVDSAVGKALVAAGTSYAGSVTVGFIGSVNWDKLGTADWINGERMKESAFGAGTIASALSAGAMAGTGAVASAKLASLGETGNAIGKFYGGAIKLGTAAAGKAVEYGTHAAYSLAQGGTLMDAYDNMGGITLNIANLGSIIDMVGSGIARNNTTAQSTLGIIAEKLGGTGLFEVTIGSEGVTGRIGSGGIDVGGAVYDLAKRGIDRAALERYAVKNAKKGAAAMNNYVYGDWTAENTSARLASGLDKLSFVDEIRNEKGEYATAQTTGSGTGRLIQMVDSGNEYNNAIQLQHESYRDGIRGSDQVGEMVQAVIAHTVMADRMRSAKVGYENTANLAQDLAAWDKAVASGDMSGFALYAMSSYDSSADFWTLTANGALVKDKDGWLRDENGLYINKDGSKTRERTGNTIGADGIETGLLNILYGGTSDKSYLEFSDGQVGMAQRLLNKSGFVHSEGAMRDVSWTEGNDNASISFENIINWGFGNTVAASVFINGYDRSTDLLLAGNGDEWKSTNTNLPDYVKDRYISLAVAKLDFYEGIQALVGGETRISGPYHKKVTKTDVNGKEVVDTSLYVNYDNQHHGLDIKALEGTPVYAGISGKIIDNPEFNDREGNSVRIEYGYQFEGFTQTTGIKGEYLHLKSLPDFKKGDFVAANRVIGAVGNTGSVSTGVHLHYGVYTEPGKAFSTNVMSKIFGANYMDEAMANKPPNNGPSTKTVYDPTSFYAKYMNKYKK